MKAMLLAAGLGTRLYPLTADRPKCMVSVAGREVLIRNIDWLRSNGIHDLVINLHHHAEAVVDSIGDGSRLGVSVAYSREPELLGTAGGVLAARSLLGDETFIVVYADNLFDVRLRAVVDEHRHFGAEASMLLLERPDVSSSGVAVLDDAGWITEFQEKPRPGTERSHWVNAGLLVCEPELFEVIPGATPSDLSLDVMPKLAERQHALRGHRLAHGERVMWIDTMDDLRATEAMLATTSGRGGR
ncbi:MAG: nucleotidyltransferase family protein [Candidatus Limnocylindrales bacterium]